MNSVSAATEKAYRSDWAKWSDYASANGVCEFPASPQAVANFATYLAHEKHQKLSSIRRALSTIAQRHTLAELPSPCTHIAVRKALDGLARLDDNGAHYMERDPEAVGKTPVGKLELLQMIAAMPATSKGIRDKAVLLVGFAACLRRSEIVGLDVSDVTFSDKGAVLHIRRSKTDQTGRGADVALDAMGANPLCPVAALRAWLAASNIANGPIFPITAQSVRLIVRESASRGGLDATNIAAHSLRSGCATSALSAGKGENQIAVQKHGRWKSLSTVSRYVRSADPHDPSRHVNPLA
jgi:integrase